MWEDYNLKLIIEAQDKFSAELKKMKWEVEQIQSVTKKTQETAESSMNAIKSTMKTLWITALIYKATSSIIQLWKEIEPIKTSFERLSSSVWVASDEMLQAMRNASNWTVSDFHLMEQANKAYSLWVVSNTEEMTTLMEIARLKGQAMWRSMEEALWDIVTWLWRASPMILDNLWIVIKQSEAQEKYAQSIWKTVDALTEQEKKQALVNAVVEQWKKELAEAWEIPETFQDKVSRLQASRENLWAKIWVVINDALWQSMAWIDDFFTQVESFIDNHIDDIYYVADTIWDIISNTLWVASDVMADIWWMVSDITSNIEELVVSLLNKTHDDTENTLDATKWDLSDFMYYFEQWMNVIGWTVSIVVSSFRAWFSTITNLFSAVIQSVVKWMEEMVNGVISAWNYVADFFWWEWLEKISLWIWSFSEIWSDALADTTATATSSWNNIESAWNRMWDNMVNTYSERVASIRNQTTWAINQINRSLWWSSSSWIWWEWSWSSSSKANKDAEKYAKAREKEFVAMQKAHKEYIKQKEKEQADYYKKVDSESREMLKRQWAVLTDLVKEYEDKFDDIQDKVKDTQKEIKKLTDDIEDIQKKIEDITKDENSSLASEFLNAKNILKDMEKEFEWISSIAEWISRDELNDAIDTDFIWWYAVSNIKKVKEALEEVSWIYDWLSEEQQKQLEDEIARQEEYNKLNRVDQIKYDYQVKKDEAQKEYEDKLSKLDDEKKKLENLQEQQAKLQEEYLWNIQDARDTYDKMYEDILKFEKDYQILFDNDMFKQQKAVRELKDLWKDVADARSKAIAYWTDIEWRASWWYVAWWTPYLVWENWPELFVPKNNWTIVPNNEITNNNGIEINISGVSVRSDADIQTITDEIIRKIKLEKTFWIA